MAAATATLQDGANVRERAAREVEGDEKAHWRALALDVWPAYAESQTKTEREIPIVVLEPSR